MAKCEKCGHSTYVDDCPCICHYRYYPDRSPWPMTFTGMVLLPWFLISGVVQIFIGKEPIKQPRTSGRWHR
jgi:hypothetical protein